VDDSPLTWVLPFRAESVRAARRALDSRLCDEGVDRTVRGEALVVLSELLANSVRHARPLAGGRVGVVWCVTSDAIDIAVVDGGGAHRPRATEAGMSESGRGLGIVDVLAARWGVAERATDQVVWAVIGRGTLAHRDC
jgi:anti-sigma regulatory factor (Ser/Thr protein kinase)